MAFCFPQNGRSGLKSAIAYARIYDNNVNVTAFTKTDLMGIFSIFKNTDLKY